MSISPSLQEHFFDEVVSKVFPRLQQQFMSLTCFDTGPQSRVGSTVLEECSARLTQTLTHVPSVPLGISAHEGTANG